jgi:hypothetical protein
MSSEIFLLCAVLNKGLCSSVGCRKQRKLRAFICGKLLDSGYFKNPAKGDCPDDGGRRHL